MPLNGSCKKIKKIYIYFEVLEKLFYINGLEGYRVVFSARKIFEKNLEHLL